MKLAKLKLINIELAHETHVLQFTLHVLPFLPFYNINKFRKKFAGYVTKRSRFSRAA